MNKLSFAIIFGILALFFAGCSSDDGDENSGGSKAVSYISKDSKGNLYTLALSGKNSFVLHVMIYDVDYSYGNYRPAITFTGKVISKETNGTDTEIIADTNGETIVFNINGKKMTNIAGKVTFSNEYGSQEMEIDEILTAVALPVIDNIAISQEIVDDGTLVTIIADITSDVELTYFGSSLYGPNGLLPNRGFETSIDYNETSPGHWQITYTEKISIYVASGEYYYTDLRVYNWAVKIGEYDYFQSAEWKKKEYVSVANSIVPQKPVITNITISLKDTVSYNDIDYKFVTMTVYAKSNVPMTWLSGSFYGPNGNIWGGGSPHTWEEISTGNWKCVRTEWVKKDTPGVYYYTNMVADNAGYLKSDPWKGELKFTI